LLIGDHVGQLRQSGELTHQSVDHAIQLVLVGIFKRVLVLGAADGIVNREVLDGLHVQLDALHLGQFRSQPLNHLGS
jgi:spermidine synthase